MQPVTMLVGLNEDACADLLAAATLGRVGVIVDGRPEIFPVCPVYEPSTGSIAFPTNVGTKLSAALHWPFVSFEIDGVDTDGRCGWSVLVTGHAEEVTSPSEVQALEAQRSSLWRSRPGARWLRIVPETTTGRLISAYDH